MQRERRELLKRRTRDAWSEAARVTSPGMDESREPFEGMVPTSVVEPTTPPTSSDRRPVGRPLDPGRGRPLVPNAVDRGGRTRFDNIFELLYALESRRGTLEILTFLGREGSASKSRLRQCLKPGPEALEGALATLLRLGLVAGETVRDFPFGSRYRLTSLGSALLRTPLPLWSSLFTR